MNFEMCTFKKKKKGISENDSSIKPQLSFLNNGSAVEQQTIYPSHKHIEASRKL